MERGPVSFHAYAQGDARELVDRHARVARHMLGQLESTSPGLGFQSRAVRSHDGTLVRVMRNRNTVTGAYVCSAYIIAAAPEEERHEPLRWQVFESQAEGAPILGEAVQEHHEAEPIDVPAPEITPEHVAVEDVPASVEPSGVSPGEEERPEEEEEGVIVVKAPFFWAGVSVEPSNENPGPTGPKLPDGYVCDAKENQNYFTVGCTVWEPGSMTDTALMDGRTIGGQVLVPSVMSIYTNYGVIDTLMIACGRWGPSGVNGYMEPGELASIGARFRPWRVIKGGRGDGELEIFDRDNNVIETQSFYQFAYTESGVLARTYANLLADDKSDPLLDDSDYDSQENGGVYDGPRWDFEVIMDPGEDGWVQEPDPPWYGGGNIDFRGVAGPSIRDDVAKKMEVDPVMIDGLYRLKLFAVGPAAGGNVFTFKPRNTKVRVIAGRGAELIDKVFEFKMTPMNPSFITAFNHEIFPGGCCTSSKHYGGMPYTWYYPDSEHVKPEDYTVFDIGDCGQPSGGQYDRRTFLIDPLGDVYESLESEDQPWGIGL